MMLERLYLSCRINRTIISRLASQYLGSRENEKKEEKNITTPSPMKRASRVGGDLLDKPISHRVSIQTCTKRKRRWFGTPREMLVNKTLCQEKGGARTNLFYYVWEMRTPKRGTRNLTLHIFSDTNYNWSGHKFPTKNVVSPDPTHCVFSEGVKWSGWNVTIY
jgi:hypothetical protein